MIKKFKTHIIFCLSALIVGGLSVFLTRDNMMLYNEIVKPPLSPPAIVFVIVRSVLYILMRTSFAIVYMHKCENAELFYSAKRIYILQLIFNFFWSIIFFNYRSFLFSALWLAALCIMVFIMIIRFKKINSLSGNLQIPYFIWTVFALYLNISVFLLNTPTV